MKTPAPALIIRIHLTDGSVASFAPPDEPTAQKIWQSIDPGRIFSQQRFVIAGTHSKSVFVCSEIIRIDFIQECWGCWEFPQGYSDVVELSEKDFRKHAHLDQPERMPKRNETTPVGDLLVSFLELRFPTNRPVFLMVEFPVKLPAENHSFMRFLLSKTSLHMRLVNGGVGVVNLAKLAGYTVYPGVAQIPGDAWIAEPQSDRPEAL
jgi:hypothetical protein